MTEEAGEETATVGVSELQGKCTRQNVLIVVLKQKYLSSLIRKDPFTAENVFPNTENPEKTDTKVICITELISKFISFHFLNKS